MNEFRTIDEKRLLATVERLRDRVCERFPDRQIRHVAEDVVELVRSNGEAIARAKRQGRPLTLVGYLLGVLILGLIVAGVVNGIQESQRIWSFAEFIPFFESLIASIVFLGAAMLFLLKLGEKRGRQISLAAIHELRTLAHVIDMHQLTKDPERLLPSAVRTASSPELNLTHFELNRYFDYCSEMLSLLGKTASLHAQGSDEPLVLGAVDQVESLCNGLARTIWQKVIVLEGMRLSPGRG